MSLCSFKLLRKYYRDLLGRAEFLVCCQKKLTNTCKFKGMHKELLHIDLNLEFENILCSMFTLKEYNFIKLE